MRRRLFARRGRRATGASAPCVGCADESTRPFGLVGTPPPRVDPDDVLVRSPGRLEAIIDDQLVVFAPATGQAHLLNPTAALVLTSVDGHSPAATIIDDLATDTGVARADLEGDVIDALGSFVRGGLVTPVAPTSPGEPTADAGGAPDVDVAARSEDGSNYWEAQIARRLDGVDWPHVLGPYQVLEATVRVRTDRDDVAGRLDAALAALPLARSGAEDASTITVDSRRVGGGLRYRIHADRERIGWVEDPDWAVGLALAGLNQLAAARSGGRVLLHGGAVERDGRVAVITGASGRGKSTLTAALVQRGFGYLTDEIVAIDRTGRVAPYPKALEVDDGALALLGLPTDPADPRSPDADGGTRGPERHIAPAQLGRVLDGGEVGLIVILDDPAAGGTEAMALPPGEGMVHLLRDTFPSTWDEPGALDAMAQICASVPIIRLPRFALDVAAETIAGWLGAAALPTD